MKNVGKDKKLLTESIQLQKTQLTNKIISIGTLPEKNAKNSDLYLVKYDEVVSKAQTLRDQIVRNEEKLNLLTIEESAYSPQIFSASCYKKSTQVLYMIQSRLSLELSFETALLMKLTSQSMERVSRRSKRSFLF